MLKEQLWITESNELLPKALFLLSETDKLFKNSKRKIAVDTPDFLINLKEYREIFPSGILPTGKPARTHIDELKKKMNTFFINNPQYDWDLVLDATEAYVEYFRKQDYSFMKTAGYFIYKNNESDLASYCEKLLEEGDNNTKIKKSIYNI